MPTQKILVVDDEEKIVNIVRAYLEKESYRVNVAFDGRVALDMARRYKPDLVILDLMLPEISGWDVCRTLRGESNVPVIMLTARDEDTDKIVGLEIGADDYVTKPFNPKELVSRVRAVLRRVDKQEKGRAIIEVGGLIIDIEKHQVHRGDEQIELTPIEFDLLSLLAQSQGRVYSRMQILDKLQDDAYEG
ncbi:MAG: response regulator transcription factor, partial [Dehalococcoidia bacterium]|nr:response regulator transcription factor [Dehalococcoidia bacterium]